MKTVAVIGLGPSGLVATKELRAKGFTVTAFDANSRSGGLWVAPGEKNGIYKELVMNGTRRFSEFSDFPWHKEDYAHNSDLPPDYGGHYPTGYEFQMYLDAYAKHFDLASSFRLNAKVVAMERMSSGGYKLTVASSATTDSATEKTTTKETLEFDAVVVCTGRDAEASTPLKDTVFKDYTGELIHSQQFQSVVDYDGKRVLVVGAYVSGSDISARLAERGKCHGQRVVNTVRTVPYHLDKFSSNGTKDKTPAHVGLMLRLVSWISPYLPYSIAMAGLKDTLLSLNPEQLTEEMTGSPDLVPDKDMRTAFIGYTHGYIPLVKDKKIILKKEATSAQGKTVTFKDGTTEEFDVVIMCTGYKGWDLSIIPDDILQQIQHKDKESGKAEPALYNRCLVPSVSDLAFVGLYNIGPLMPAIEMTARYTAAVFAEDLARPSERVMQKQANALRKHREAGRFNRYDVITDICGMVGKELGVIPTLWQALCNPSELLFGPMYPSYYRTNPKVEGEEVAQRAKARYEWCKKNPMRGQDVY